MRVLVMAHGLPPVQNCGAEWMLVSMLRALVARGHDVDVTLSRQTGAPYDLHGIRVWPHVSKRDAFEWLPKADVIVAHLENTPRATLLGRWHGLPVVHVLHNTYDNSRNWLHRDGGPSLAVANSDWMLADYRAWTAARDVPMPRTVVVRPPVIADDYRTTPGEHVTLINLSEAKGARVFYALAARMPKTRFLGVVGGHGDQIVRRDLPNVEIVEHIDGRGMRERVYSRTRVLLAPSVYESWGRVAVEAMVSGIPVIAHPTPGLRESCGVAGIFCDRGDIDAWSRALRTLALPAAYKAASRRALERAVQLDPAADLDLWCDELERVASRRLVRV